MVVTVLVMRRAPLTHANPAQVWVINDHVGAAVLSTTPAAFDTALLTSAATRVGANITPANLSIIEAAGGGEVSSSSQAMAFAGHVFVVVQSDGSATGMTLNGRGLNCTPSCDGLSFAFPDATDHMAVWTVSDAGTHSLNDKFVVTAVQDAVSLDSKTLTVAGQAHDVQLTLANNKTTIQEQAPSCGLSSSGTVPSRATAIVTYTDINGVPLAGYMPTLASSNAAVMLVGSGAGTGASQQTLMTIVNADGKTAAEDAVCGVATGSADLTATTTANEIVGIFGSVTRTQTIAVTGVSANIALTASPAVIACDGIQTSTVTAKVTDTFGNNVVDGTTVSFSLVSSAIANPMQTTTTGGSASSTITPLLGTSAVVVVVQSGSAEASIRIDCAPPNPDFLAQAIDIGSLPQTVGLSTVGATLEAGEPQPCGNIGATIWLRYDVPASPPGVQTVSVDTVGSYFNTAIAVYTMTSPSPPPGSLALIGCNANGATSGVTFTALPGMTYYVQAGGLSGATGYLVVNASPDTDGDGYTDIQEIRLGKNPNVYCSVMRADMNGDGEVNGLDLALLAKQFLQPAPPADARRDLNGDGLLNALDLALLGKSFLKNVSACP